jgi:Ras GTPase-activating protein 1
MEVINPFILKNKERMIVFLDQLSNVTDPYMLQSGLDIINNSNTVIDQDTGKFYFIFF